MKILSLIILIYPIISKIPEDEFINLNANITNNILKQQNQEIIFSNNAILPYIILSFGVFIILYGAYYNFFIVIKLTLFLYYILSLFISTDDPNKTRNLLFILLFSFMSSVLLYITYKSQIKTVNKYYLKHIFFGMMTGCFLNQLIFHFVYTFKNNYEQNIYYILFPIFIVIFGIANIKLPKKIVFIPCSVVSGLFFIKLSIDGLLNYELKKGEKIIDLIVCIIIAVLAFIYQIYHLNRKKGETPGIFIDNEIREIPTKKNLDISQAQNLNSSNSQEMMNKTSGEVDVTQDNNIDDQDD